jgi:hypothetical protein
MMLQPESRYSEAEAQVEGALGRDVPNLKANISKAKVQSESALV